MNTELLIPIINSLEQQNYAVIDNFFAAEDVAAWRDDARAFYQQGSFSSARIGRGDNLAINSTIRRDSIFWLEPHSANPVQQRYLDFLEQLRIALNRRFMLGLFSAECHYAHYEAGSFYKKHLDRHQASAQRVVSVITYLNETWREEDGGELRLYLEDRIEDVKPIAGTVVCFFSDAIPHEVLTVNRERLSLTAWLRIRGDDVL